MSTLDQRNVVYLARCRDLIAKHGHMVQGVFAAVDGPQRVPFAYTIGLSLSEGHRFELAVSGLSSPDATVFLNRAAKMVRDGELVPDAMTELDGFFSGFPARFRRAKGHVEWGPLAALAGDDVVVWQMVFPDKAGRFPSDKGYDLVGVQEML